MDGYPVTEKAWETSLSIPIYPSLPTEHVERIIGVFMDAYEKGYILVMNEFDMYKPEIISGLHDTIFSKKRSFTIKHTTPKGKVVEKTVRRHKNFRVVVTCNSRGYGDDDAIYEGIEHMNAATLERFPVKISMDYVDRDTELEILKEYYPKLDEDYLDKLTEFAEKARMLFKIRECKTIISTFRLIKWGKYIEEIGPELAFQSCILEHSNKNDFETFRQIYHRLFINEAEDEERSNFAEIIRQYPCFTKFKTGDPICEECEQKDNCIAAQQRTRG